MKDTIWIVVSQRGAKRMVKSLPALGYGEYAVRIALEVPNSVFAPIPIAQASIVVAHEDVMVPNVAVEVAPLPDDATSAPAAVTQEVVT